MRVCSRGASAFAACVSRGACTFTDLLEEDITGYIAVSGSKPMCAGSYDTPSLPSNASGPGVHSPQSGGLTPRLSAESPRAMLVASIEFSSELPSPLGRNLARQGEATLRVLSGGRMPRTQSGSESNDVPPRRVGSPPPKSAKVFVGSGHPRSPGQTLRCSTSSEVLHDASVRALSPLTLSSHMDTVKPGAGVGKQPQSPRASVGSPKCAGARGHGSFAQASLAARAYDAATDGSVRGALSRQTSFYSSKSSSHSVEQRGRSPLKCQARELPNDGRVGCQHDVPTVRAASGGTMPSQLDGMATGTYSNIPPSAAGARRQPTLRKLEKTPRDVANLAAKYLEKCDSNGVQRISKGCAHEKPVQTCSNKDTTPERNWRSTGCVKSSTPERGWRRSHAGKDAALRTGVRRKDSTPEQKRQAVYMPSDLEASPLATGADTPQRNRRSLQSMQHSTLGSVGQTKVNSRDGQRSLQLQCSRGSSPDQIRRCPGGNKGVFSARQPLALTCATPQRGLSTEDRGGPSKGESLIQSLVRKGFLSDVAGPWSPGCDETLNDLAYVRALFSSQVPSAHVSGVYRIENGGLKVVYSAVRTTMGTGAGERGLWHGTSLECVRNIALNGFNRAYCGRHGMKFGQGTYFSSSADYSVRFCDRKRPERLMFLASVLVGTWTKGSPELVEPPHRDVEGLARYDSTVDDVHSPSIFCVFRDFQALPLYLVQFFDADHSLTAC